MTSQLRPNGWVNFGGGASWGTFGAIIHKDVLKSAPKVILRLQKCLQKTSQSAKSESQVLENSRKWQRFGSWPGGLREALTISLLLHICFSVFKLTVHMSNCCLAMLICKYMYVYYIYIYVCIYYRSQCSANLSNPASPPRLGSHFLCPWDWVRVLLCHLMHGFDDGP